MQLLLSRVVNNVARGVNDTVETGRVAQQDVRLANGLETLGRFVPAPLDGTDEGLTRRLALGGEVAELGLDGGADVLAGEELASGCMWSASQCYGGVKAKAGAALRPPTPLRPK